MIAWIYFNIYVYAWYTDSYHSNDRFFKIQLEINSALNIKTNTISFTMASAYWRHVSVEFNQLLPLLCFYHSELILQLQEEKSAADTYTMNNYFDPLEWRIAIKKILYNLLCMKFKS